MPSTQVERPTASTAHATKSDRREPRSSEFEMPAVIDQDSAPSDCRGALNPGAGTPQPSDRCKEDSGHGTELPILAIRLMTGLGKGLMIIGVLILAFAAFQLWGTGLSEARAQSELADRFANQLRDQRQLQDQQQSQAAVDPRLEDAATVGQADGAPTTPDKPEPLVVAVPDDPAAENNQQAEQRLQKQEQQLQEQKEDQGLQELAAVEVGDPIGVLTIPAIGVEKTIAEGTTRDVLRSGPGHYPSTPRPGQRGNVAIAGHRTTHGAPFLDIDQLNPGDEITVETVEGTYTYAVEGQLDSGGNAVGHLIVRPEDVGVIMDQGDDRLTLTACHPKYSARERIIVTAVLVSAPPAPPAPTPDPDPGLDATQPSSAAQANQEPDPESGPPVAPELPTKPLDDLAETAIDDLAFSEPAFEETAGSESLGWQARYAMPTGLWAAATALIGLLGWGFGRIWRRFPAYAMAVPPLTLSLYYCFVNLERFIPAV